MQFVYFLYLRFHFVIPTHAFFPPWFTHWIFILHSLCIIISYLKSAWAIKRSKFLKSKYNYPTRSQNNNDNSNFIATGSFHCGLTCIRHHPRHLTSIFSFILHNDLLTPLWLRSRSHRKQSTDRWCPTLISSGVRTWTHTVCLWKGSLWFTQVLKLSRSPDSPDLLSDLPGFLCCLTVRLSCCVLPSLGGLLEYWPDFLCGWVSRSSHTWAPVSLEGEHLKNKGCVLLIVKLSAPGR